MIDDDLRDAHLKAALRHAPDHDAAAPPLLSARILARSRQALEPPPLSGVARWLDRWFGWMGKPVAAGAFGTVMIAGVIGLLWRDGAPPQALPGGDRSIAAAPEPPPPAAAAPAPAAAPAAPVAEAPAPPAPAAPRERAAALTKATAPRAEADGSADRRSPRKLAEAEAKRKDEAAATAERLAAATAPAAADRQLADKPPAAPAATPAPPPPAAEPPRVAAAPTPFPATPPAAAQAPPAPAARYAPPPAAPGVGSSDRDAPPARGGTAVAEARDSQPQRGAMRPSQSAINDPLAAPQAALEPYVAERRMRVERDGLVRLREATRGQWQRIAATGSDVASRGEAITDGEGRLLGRLLIEPHQVTWQDAAGAVWRAPLRSESATPAASR